MSLLKNFKFWLIVFVGLIYISLVYYYKWVSSDGLSVVYQSYNVINGLGLVWNLGERTYVSTSPLFTITSVILTYFFDSFFDLFNISANRIIYIPIIINIIFSIASIIVILKFLYSKVKTFSTEKLILLILSFGLLISSKFFIHFSTSGLENSLSYLVISLFTILSCSENTAKVKSLLPIVASLVFLTRYDFLLIISPTLLYYLYKYRITKGFLIMSIIIFCWFIFSFVYFGSILPNSFYVKTKGHDFYQSLFYFKANLFESPTMFILLGIGIYCSYIINKRFFLGIISYLTYIFIVRDYMFGRLFTPLVPLCIILIISFITTSKFEEYRIHFIKFAGISLTLFIILFYFPPVTKFYNHEIMKGRFPLSDERSYYTKIHNFSTENFIYTKPSKTPTFVNINVQMLHAPLLRENKNAYFLDPIGLANPFVTYYIKNYGAHKGEKPGHSFVDLKYLKKIGLFETVIQDKNLLENKNIYELYNDVNIVSKGNIFDLNRLKTIIKLQTHKYNNTLPQ